MERGESDQLGQGGGGDRVKISINPFQQVDPHFHHEVCAPDIGAVDNGRIGNGRLEEEENRFYTVFTAVY
jgi:hypothetical protein